MLRNVRATGGGCIPFGIIAVLTDFSLDFADEMFQFFIENGLYDVSFNIDEIEGIHTSTSFGPKSCRAHDTESS